MSSYMSMMQDSLWYTNDEDEALVKTSEKVSLDAVTRNYQTEHNYWQHNEDMLH